jgi:hypothetical protein
LCERTGVCRDRQQQAHRQAQERNHQTTRLFKGRKQARKQAPLYILVTPNKERNKEQENEWNVVACLCWGECAIVGVGGVRGARLIDIFLAWQKKW